MYNNSQQSQTDQTANFFWLLVLCCIALLSIWYFVPKYIVTPIFWLRQIELSVLIFFSNLWNVVADHLHLPAAPIHQLADLKGYIAAVEPKTLNFSDFKAVNFMIGDWIRWPVMVSLLIMAVLAYFRHSNMLFRQKYDMNVLKKLESENWPQIQPVLSLDLVNEGLNEGPWAMAKTPLDFCKEHNIVRLSEKEGKKVWSVDKGPAARLFSMQLGPLWKDIFNLPIHVKALMVVFVSRAERDRDISKKFLAQIAKSAASGKLDFSGVNEALIKYQHSKLLRWVRPRHAYVRTMMATLLEMARADGVLASAEFLWLKPVDRKLWYMLNSIGRQTAVIEVSGVFAHWKAEKAFGRAMVTPMVKEAVKALEYCVADILYIDGEERWRSSEA